jgi:hypothetical protein
MVSLPLDIGNLRHGFAKPLQAVLQGGTDSPIMLLTVGNECVIVRKRRHCAPHPYVHKAVQLLSYRILI